MPLLCIRKMTHYFGGLRAVHNYNLEMDPGQVIGLIGPNGAGKTTIFNLITGIYRPDEGEILMLDKDIIGLPPHRIASIGIGRTFQDLRLWRHMTVLEHVRMARYSRIRYGLLSAFFCTSKHKSEERENEEKAGKFLDILGIGHLSGQLVTNLPYGAQRRVEIARALAMEPKVLFLDEPTAGMNPEELIRMMDIIRQIRDELGLAILLIEHRLRVVMELCERIQTMVFGEVIAEGTPREIQNNAMVIDAYLGKETVA